MSILRATVLAVLLAFALAACTGAVDSAEPTTGPAPSREGSTEPESPAQQVPDALKFKARTVDGGSLDMTTLAGKDVVLWFWAPWCTTCRREAPSLASVQKETADDVTFVGVGGLGPVTDMESFVADYRVGSFAHLVDADGKIWKRFGVVQQPAHAFIDDDGSVKVVRGELDRQRLADHVEALIAD